MSAAKQTQLRSLPEDAHRWNRALRGAYLKGQRAQLEGEPKSACPYADHRTLRGRLTWSRAYEKAWSDGWRWQAEVSK